VAKKNRIDKELARERFAAALELACSDSPLPYEWSERTERVAQAASKSFVPALGTALLAKATNRHVDASALRASAGHKGYSARSLAKDVFVPSCERAGVDIRTTGAEPLNNQPFLRASKIDRSLEVKANARNDLHYLCDCIEAADFLEGKEALEALAAFLRERIRAAGIVRPVSLGPGVLELHALAEAVNEYVRRWNEGGKIGQGLVAAILDVAYEDVRTERINDPSAKWPGDVGIFANDKLWTAVEVKQRHFTDTEALQFAKRLADAGVDRGIVAELGQAPSALECTALSRIAYEQRRVDIAFVFSPGELLFDSVRRSNASLSAIMRGFQQLGMTRLEEIEASDAAREAWASLFT